MICVMHVNASREYNFLSVLLTYLLFADSKEDYDLCDACFSLMGNETEYTRLDMPASKCVSSRHTLMNSPESI